MKFEKRHGVILFVVFALLLAVTTVGLSLFGYSKCATADADRPCDGAVMNTWLYFLGAMALLLLLGTLNSMRHNGSILKMVTTGGSITSGLVIAGAGVVCLLMRNSCSAYDNEDSLSVADATQKMSIANIVIGGAVLLLGGGSHFLV